MGMKLGPDSLNVRALSDTAAPTVRLHLRAQLVPTEHRVKTKELHPAPPATADAAVLLGGKAATVKRQKRAQLEQTGRRVKTEEVHLAPPAIVDAHVLLGGRATIVQRTSTNVLVRRAPITARARMKSTALHATVSLDGVALLVPSTSTIALRTHAKTAGRVPTRSMRILALAVPVGLGTIASKPQQPPFLRPQRLLRLQQPPPLPPPLLQPQPPR